MIRGQWLERTITLRGHLGGLQREYGIKNQQGTDEIWQEMERDLVISGAGFCDRFSAVPPVSENEFPPGGPNFSMLPAESSPSVERREFLRGALRYATLTGIAGVAAALARRAPLNGPACGGQGICGGCSFLGGCQETRAAAARQDGNLNGDSP